MTESLLRLYLFTLHYAGWYVLLIVLIFAAAFAIVGVVVAVEEGWRWLVRRIRRYRLSRVIDQEREAHRLRIVALTGTKGLPRRVWEGREPWDGGTAA